ncbi:MAG: hypothetical protein RRA92_03430 [Gemmatimonadota bacterium]|nr:hypothetical protein [Gemmatimonadota bacterium]
MNRFRRTRPAPDRTRLLRAAAAVLLLVAAAGPATAQQSPLAGETRHPSDAPAGGLEFTAYAGVFSPLANLARLGDTLTAELGTKISGSVGVDWWLRSGIGIGLFGGYVQPDLTVQIIGGPGTFPAVADLGKVDMWYGVATLMYRPEIRGPARILRPYVLAGGGLVHVGSGSVAATENLPEFSVESSTSAAGVIGIGGHMLLGGPWHLRLDIRDFISSYDTDSFPETRTQHDLVSSIGLGLRL